MSQGYYLTVILTMELPTRQTPLDLDGVITTKQHVDLILILKTTWNTAVVVKCSLMDKSQE